MMGKMPVATKSSSFSAITFENRYIRLSASLYLTSVILKPPYILDVSLRGQIKWPDELGVACFLGLACALLKILRGGHKVVSGRALILRRFYE
jgi:hypothetical protein